MFDPMLDPTPDPTLDPMPDPTSTLTIRYAMAEQAKTSFASSLNCSRESSKGSRDTTLNAEPS